MHIGRANPSPLKRLINSIESVQTTKQRTKLAATEAAMTFNIVDKFQAALDKTKS